MYKILVADDHAVVRKGIVQILHEAPGVEVRGEASSGQEVLDLVRREHWDAVVLDLSMPGMSGLDVLRRLREQRPELPVLVLSIHPQDQFAVRVLRAGAAGYLTKDSAPDELARAVQKVCGGGRYVSASLAEMLVLTLGEDFDRPSHESLSDREFQVLRMLASGRTVSEIGDRLSLSAKTISTYRARILQKTGMRTTAELMRYALEHRLVEDA